MIPDPSFFVTLTCWLIAPAIAISAAEWLRVSNHFAPHHIFNWRIISTLNAPRSPGIVRSMWDAFAECPRVRVLFVVEILLALSLAASAHLPIRTIPLACLSILLIGRQAQTPFGRDGADQMMILIVTALALGSIGGTPVSLALALGFISGQACLSYTISGIAKLCGKPWWGNALADIMATRNYGHPALAAILHNRYALTRLLTALVIVGEISFWVVLLLPPEPRLGLLVAAGVFHVATAIFMGLNTFLWAFVASYPSVWFVAHVLQSS